MGVLEILFNLIAVYYLYRGVQLVWRGWQERERLLVPRLTPRGKQYAEQGAFYVAVPPGVLLHEVGHAVAVWAFGGAVVEFGFFAYWGYVLPDRVFPPTEEWFVALAGTLGSLLYAVMLWLVLRRSDKPFLRYFGLRGTRFHLYFALLYYPILTVILGIGDWRTIYDFGATPLLSGVTAASHAVLLGGLLWVDRKQGWFDMAAFRSVEEQQQLETVARLAEENPENSGAQVAYAQRLLRSGLRARAEQVLQGVIERDPGHAEAYFWLGMVRMEQQRDRQAADLFRQAVDNGLPDDGLRGFAHNRIGFAAFERGDHQEALRHYDASLSNPHQVEEGERARRLIDRSRAHRQLGNLEQAEADLDEARRLAAAAGRQDLQQRIEQDAQALAYRRQK